RRLVFQANTLSDLAAALAILDEVRRLQQEGVWKLLPDTYFRLREKLVYVTSAGPSLLETEHTRVKRALKAIRDASKAVSVGLQNGTAPENPEKLNEIRGEHLDALQTVLVARRTRMTEGNHGQ